MSDSGESELQGAILDSCLCSECNEGSEHCSAGSKGPGVLLTKTLATSPVINQILEVNLRGHNSQDIVLIKSHTIELYTFSLTSFTLISSLPFTGKIQTAIRYNRSRLRNQAWDDFSKLISSRPNPHLLDAYRARSTDIILCTVNTSLASELAIVDWDQGVQNERNFCLPGLRLANKMRVAEQPLDFKSHLPFLKLSEDLRWLLLGSSQNPWFILHQLEDRIIRNPQSQLPLYNDGKHEIVSTATRVFYVEGLIWHLEFVKPVHSDGPRIIALTLDAYGTPKVILYDRPPSGGSNINNINNIRIVAACPLSQEFQCPLHMIPLNTGDVCIVYEKEIVIVNTQDLTVGSHEPISFREDLSFLEGGLVTAYTKGPVETENNILLGSSKGNVYSISWDKLGTSDHSSLQMSLIIVHKTNPVGAALYYGQIRCQGSEHGTLFVSGEMCDGAIYLVHTKPTELLHVESLPNWSPVVDCQLVSSFIGDVNDGDVVSRTIDPLAASFPPEFRHRLYVGSGHRAEGSVRELRTGLRTNVTVEFEYKHVRQIWVLPLPTQDKEGYILVSLTFNETKVFRWRSPTSRSDGVPWSGELDIDDITDKVANDLSTSEETLAAGISNEDIFQITPTGIYSPKFRRSCPRGRLIQASIMKDHLAFVTYAYESDAWTLWSADFMDFVRAECRPNKEKGDSAIPQHSPFEDYTAQSDGVLAGDGVSAGDGVLAGFCDLSEEPTALKLFSCPNPLGDDVRMCLVGLRSRVLLYCLDSPSKCVAEYSDQGYFEVHSLECMSVGPDLYVLIGMRNGELRTAKIEGPLSSFPAFKGWVYTVLGNSQVEFIPTNQHVNIEKDGVGVFVCCERLYELNGRNGVEVQLNEVLFDAYRMPGVSGGSLTSRQRELVLVMNGVIRFVDVGKTFAVWPRTISIGQTPRRMIYDTKMQRMVVACSNVESELGTMNHLAIVDLLRNEYKVLSTVEKANEEVSNLFLPNQTINSLFEWRIEINEKMFSLLCLGMSEREDKANTNQHPRGRIVIISCRLSASNNRTVKAKVIRKFPTQHPVYAMTTMGDRHLVYSSGKCLNMITWYPRSEEEGPGYRFRLENRENVYVGRSAIIQLGNEGGSYFVCSTLGDSCSVLVWDEETSTFLVRTSDPTPRLTTVHFVSPEHVIFVADKEGKLVGLTRSDPGKAAHSSLRRVIEARMKSPITRLEWGVLQSPCIGHNGWKKSCGVAVGIDGSVTAFKLVPETLLKSLRWVQRYCMTHNIYRYLYPVFMNSEDEDFQHLNIDLLMYISQRTNHMISFADLSPEFQSYLNKHPNDLNREGVWVLNLFQLVGKILREEFSKVSL